MSPEDEMLTRTVLYVGLGLAFVCVTAALIIQTWMVRKGRATRKDLRDLVTGLGWTAFFGAATMLARSGEHPGQPSAWMQAIGAALFTSLIVSLLPEWINGGAEAVRAVASGWGLRAALSMIYAAAVVTFMALAITYFLPTNWLLKAIALFAGCVSGLIWRAVRLARASRPEDPPEAESLIIRADS